jgi:ADP-ribose pyrophosphatase
VAGADADKGLEWVLKDSRPGPAGFLKVETRSYVMPDGQVADWDVLRGGRTVAMLAITDDQQVVLVRQFRPGPVRVLAELPGGNVGDGEDVADAARRELLEEAGYRAGAITVVGQTWLASYATHERYAVIATGCRLVAEGSRDVHADALEFIEPVTMALDDFRAHAAGGQLTDTDIALMCLSYLDRAARKSAAARP